jgi:membrane protein required for beta-lactamase induction
MACNPRVYDEASLQLFNFWKFSPHLLSLVICCILYIFWVSELCDQVQSGTTTQLLFIYLLIVLGFCFGSITVYLYYVDCNHQHCQHFDDANSSMDDVNLEEIAVANLQVLHRDGRESSNAVFVGMSNKVGEVC